MEYSYEELKPEMAERIKCLAPIDKITLSLPFWRHPENVDRFEEFARRNGCKIPAVREGANPLYIIETRWQNVRDAVSDAFTIITYEGGIYSLYPSDIFPKATGDGGPTDRKHIYDLANTGRLVYLVEMDYDPEPHHKIVSHFAFLSERKAMNYAHALNVELKGKGAGFHLSNGEIYL